MFDLRVIGGRKLEAKMKKLEKKVASKIMRESLKTAMEPVKELSKRLAPVERGLMRRSIRVRVTSKRDRITALVGTGTRKQLRIDADDPYYYPAAIEYGTRHIPAKSFLRRSLGRLKSSVLNRVGSEIKRSLESAR